MKNDTPWTSVVASLILVVVASAAWVVAQEPAEAELPMGMTAEQMAAWEKAASPGAEHALLATMVGEWTFTGTFWMAPGTPPMTSTGTASRKMIHGGRVLVETAKSEMMGEVFEGLGMTGFDNVSGDYWGTWTDNMGTGLMVSSGSCKENRCEYTATYNDPMIGGPKTVRMTMTCKGDHEVHELFEPGPDGEFKSMELVYRRAD